MRKTENKENIVDYIEQEIKLLKVQFSKYQEYLTDEFYQKIVEDLANDLDGEKIISITLANLAMKELSRIVNDEDINLELELVNDYRSKTQFLMRKLNIPTSVIKKIEEDVLMEAIETYDASCTFYVHILKCTKNKIESLKKNEKIKNEKSSKKDGLEKPTKVPGKEKLSFNDKLNVYITKKNIEKRKPSYLENAFRIIRPFIGDIKEPQLNKFIYLRYGYHDDIYFSLDDISNILNIDQEKAVSYYNMSLSLLKSGVDTAINQYLKQESSKIKKIEK